MKIKYRYLGRSNGIMAWESTTRVLGDSLVERITCSVGLVLWTVEVVIGGRADPGVILLSRDHGC